ncbi:sister chromatid cohesion protein PDS5 homolog A-like [Tubulanus polymorphus]|uniref:sister chromatid cohesion protein PDS5 homolog A-like n=1 Tax=Tubulanus polymorphus TaxID=672921 RepID=UPI003DA688C7
MPMNTSTEIIYPPGCKGLDEDVGSDSEMLRRLKAIALKFREMGQEDNSQYRSLALYLASEPFMDHTNKDIRLLTACCLADVFRIFAPDAPYMDDAEKVKEIFLFFVKQLRGLEDTESASFKRCFYLLENLAYVKSFNICIDIDDTQEVFCSLFKCFFGIISEKHTTPVKNCMLDIMGPILTESDNVSQELLDIILLTIVEPYKSQNREANSLARDLIRRTANSISAYIQTFFNNSLVIGKTSESEVSDHIFHLIYELNQIAPNILLSVLPQLEFKLKSNDESERKLVTRLLAKMFSDKDSDLAMTNQKLWICFLGRFNDINLGVRTTCVLHSQQFILNQPDLKDEITEQLKMRLHDAEESVRHDAVMAIVNAAKKDLSAVTDDLLALVKERTLDKKFKIRREALIGLSQIYKKGVLLAEDRDPIQSARISWIKDKVLHGYYQNNIEDKVLIERLFKLNLVPYSYDHESRMNTLYELYESLDHNSVKALNEMLRCQNQILLLVRQIMSLKPEHEQIRQNKIMAIIRTLPEQHRTSEHIKKFFSMVRDDKGLEKSMLKLISIDCTCKDAEEKLKDILRKMGNPNPSNTCFTNVKTLVERIAPVMVDVHAMKYLIKLVDSALCNRNQFDGEKGMQLMLMLSSVYPGAFNHEDVYKQLIAFLKSDDESISYLAIKIFCNIGDRLHKVNKAEFENLKMELEELGQDGNPKQAKNAIKCLKVVCPVTDDKVFSSIFQNSKTGLDPANPTFETAIVAVGQIAGMFPDVYRDEAKSIISNIFVKKLLMQDLYGEEGEGPDNWCDREQCSSGTRAKLHGIKAIVRWLVGLKSNANGLCTSTMRLLITVINNNGDLMEHGKISKADMAHLRLAAACGIVKLAQEHVYTDIVQLHHFQTVALILNDACYQVRRTFAQKLNHGLMQFKLPLEYMAMFSLAASDPVADHRNAVKGYIQKNISKRREYLKFSPAANAKIFSLLPEYVLPYTIHLLAHDPDFVRPDDVEMLASLKECLWFILEPLMMKNEQYNYTFFHKMLENIKQTKDAQCPENQAANERMYAVCDLAMGIVVTKTTSFILKDFLAEPVLPKKLFTRPDQNYANTKFYLPKEFAFSPPKKKQAINLLAGIRTAPSYNPSTKTTANKGKSPSASSSQHSPSRGSQESIDLIKRLASGAAAKFDSANKKTSDSNNSAISTLAQTKVNVPSKLKQSTLSPLKRSNKDNTVTPSPPPGKAPKKSGALTNGRKKPGQPRKGRGGIAASDSQSSTDTTGSPAAPRPRGRPRKDLNVDKKNVASPSKSVTSNDGNKSSPLKRKVGRTPANKALTSSSSQSPGSSDESSPPKRGRFSQSPSSSESSPVVKRTGRQPLSGKNSSSAKRLGRPPRAALSDDTASPASGKRTGRKPPSQTSSEAGSPAVKRPGRKPSSQSSGSSAKRGRAPSSQSSSDTAASPATKRPRGRPAAVKQQQNGIKPSPKNNNNKKTAVSPAKKTGNNLLNKAKKLKQQVAAKRSPKPPPSPAKSPVKSPKRNLMSDFTESDSSPTTSPSKPSPSRKRASVTPLKGPQNKRNKTSTSKNAQSPAKKKTAPPEKKKLGRPKKNVRTANIPNGVSDSQSSGRSSRKSTPSSTPASSPRKSATPNKATKRPIRKGRK